MSAFLMKKLLKHRAREIHTENVAISADDPAIEPCARYHHGFKGNLPTTSDINRRVRRAIERNLVNLAKRGSK